MLLPETLSVLLACSSVTPPDGGRERAAAKGREGVCGGLYTAAMELEKRAPNVTGYMHARTHIHTHMHTRAHAHMHTKGDTIQGKQVSVVSPLDWYTEPCSKQLEGISPSSLPRSLRFDFG